MPGIKKTQGSRRSRAAARGPKSTKPAVKKLNKHINFGFEGKKTNAWKVDTPVICSKCKKKFILPFKPRKAEVYCDECFKTSKKNIKL